jgi:hypothetical protein
MSFSPWFPSKTVLQPSAHGHAYPLHNERFRFANIPPQVLTLRDVTATQWNGLIGSTRGALLSPPALPQPLMFNWPLVVPSSSLNSEGGGPCMPVVMIAGSSLLSPMSDLSKEKRSTGKDATDIVSVDSPVVRVSLKKCSNFSPKVPPPTVVDSKDRDGNRIRRLQFRVPQKVFYKVVDTRSMVKGLFGSHIPPSSLKEIGKAGSGRFVPSALARKSGWNHIVEHIIPTLFPEHLKKMHQSKAFFSSVNGLCWDALEADCDLVPQSSSQMHWRVSCECAERRKGSKCCPLTAAVGGMWGTFYFDKSGDLVVEKPCTCVTLVLNNDGTCVHEEVTTEGYLRGVEMRKELARLVVENGPTKVRYVRSFILRVA